MSYLNDLVIMEHRLCVKIITHFYNNYKNYKDSVLSGPFCKGHLSEEQFGMLKEWIFKYEHCDYHYEKGYPPNPLEDILSIYFLFFKYIMCINGGVFELRKDVKNRCDLILALLPEHRNPYSPNSFDWAWEEIRRSSDEFEVSRLVEPRFLDPILDPLFRRDTIVPVKKRFRPIKDETSYTHDADNTDDAACKDLVEAIKKINVD